MKRNYPSIKINIISVGSHYPTDVKVTLVTVSCPFCNYQDHTEQSLGWDINEWEFVESKFTCPSCGGVFGPTALDKVHWFDEKKKA